MKRPEAIHCVYNGADLADDLRGHVNSPNDIGDEQLATALKGLIGKTHSLNGYARDYESPDVGVKVIAFSGQGAFLLRITAATGSDMVEGQYKAQGMLMRADGNRGECDMNGDYPFIFRLLEE
jgi:hypothetical protein